MGNLVNPYIFSIPLVELARDTSFYKSGTNAASYSSDARGIGAASATRKVYALITAAHGTVARTLSSATIGGVAATIEVQNSGPSGFSVSAIISAVVPTGTTAVVAATFSGAMNVFACGVIALDLLASGVADTVSASATGETVDSGAAFDLPSGGYAMAIATSEGEEDAVTGSSWTGPLTEFIDDSQSSDGGFWPFTAAFVANASDSTGNTVSVDMNYPNGKSLVAISVR